MWNEHKRFKPLAWRLWSHDPEGGKAIGGLLYILGASSTRAVTSANQVAGCIQATPCAVTPVARLFGIVVGKVGEAAEQVELLRHLSSLGQE